MKALSWFIEGRMRLMTMSFSKPATERCSARKSSAMPPVASLRSSVYLPKARGRSSPWVVASAAGSPASTPADCCTISLKFAYLDVFRA